MKERIAACLAFEEKIVRQGVRTEALRALHYLLVTDSPHGKLRFGVPQHALRFYFPHLWPAAEAGS